MFKTIEGRDPTTLNPLRMVFGATVVLLFVTGYVTASVLLVFAGAIIVEILPRIRDWQKRRGSESWPQTQATVESVDVCAKGRHYYAGDIAYSYSALGAFYSGSYRRYFKTEKEAQEFVEMFLSLVIPVRYNPQEPDTSLMTDRELRGARAKR
jgi:hypothetical protein